MGRRSHKPAATYGRPSRHRASRSLLALLAGALAFSAVVAINRDTALPLAQLWLQHPEQIAAQDSSHAAAVLLVPLACAITAFLLASLAVRAIRLAIYRAALHRWAHAYLNRHAALYRLGIQPRAVRFTADGQARSGNAEEVDTVLNSSRTLLLLGGPGSGKTIALYARLYELTRRRQLFRLITGRAPLPVFLSLASYERTLESSEATLERFIVDQMQRFSTAGFAWTVPRWLRSGKVTLLCDGLDTLDEHERTTAATELATLASAHQGRPQVVVTFSLPAYLAESTALSPLHRFERATLVELGESDVLRALRRTRRPAKARIEGELRSVLREQRLDLPARLPATLDALLELWSSERALPAGRGQLFADATELWIAQVASRSESEERVGVVLGALAATLRRLDVHTVLIPPRQALGKAVTAWIEHEGPLLPVQFAERMDVAFAPQEVEQICQAALATGILVRTPDDRALAFPHTVMEAAYAAAWLRSAYDGLGRISPELLRPQWVLPVLLRSGAPREAGDLAQRFLRLTDAPETTATRIGLASSAEAEAAVVALALAVVAEGLSVLLAAPETAEVQAVLEVGQQHLRDVLDAALRQIGRRDQEDVLGRMLRSVEREAGAELVANLADLATSTRIARLARAQLIMVLGLMATERSLEAGGALLPDTDPVLRQAVSQALASAGAAALAPLRSALDDANEQVRAHAGKALAQVGDAAVAATVAALESSEASARIAAAHTLGALRSLRAVAPLITRLDDPNSAVRVAAAQALGEVASGPAVEALRRLETHDDAAMRVAVAQALGTARASDALPTLLKLLEDDAAPVRAAAAEALGVLGDERAVPALQARRADADRLTQNAVLNALRRLGRR